MAEETKTGEATQQEPAKAPSEPTIADLLKQINDLKSSFDLTQAESKKREAALRGRYKKATVGAVLAEDADGESYNEWLVERYGLADADDEVLSDIVNAETQEEKIARAKFASKVFKAAEAKASLKAPAAPTTPAPASPAAAPAATVVTRTASPGGGGSVGESVTKDNIDKLWFDEETNNPGRANKYEKIYTQFLTTGKLEE